MSSSNVQKATPSKSGLITDIQRANKGLENSITRRQYRQRGSFSERQWSKVFPNFKAFLNAAGISTDRVGTATEAGTPRLGDSDEFFGDTWHKTLTTNERIDTLDKLLAHCKVDTLVWEVERWTCNKWEVGAKDADSKIQVTPLFQVKATLKRRTEVIAVRDEIERLKEDAKKVARVPAPTVRSIVRSGNMLEINIPDAHFGKLSWGVETRFENYDTSIAEKMFLRALETLLERTKSYKFDQVLFVVGNDLFNSDDVEGRTTKGTTVTTDGRYHKTFYKVRRTITQCIERLREVAPVKVVMVSGNHDDLSVWHLGDSLECYFAKYKDVEIENTPTHYKYHQFGKVMLMFTHGDKGKRSEYPQLMAREQPEMWGSTQFRECHTGHTHMTKLDEKYGVRVRVLPALCPPDDWHSENGYVGNLRNAEAFVWNKDEGLVNQAYYNDDSQPPILTKREIVEA